MIRRPTISTLTDPLCPYTTLFLSGDCASEAALPSVIVRVVHDVGVPITELERQSPVAADHHRPAVRHRALQGVEPKAGDVHVLHCLRGDRKSKRLNSSHYCASRMPSSA